MKTKLSLARLTPAAVLLVCFAWLGLSIPVRAGIERDIGQLDVRVTQPRNPAARNFGVWNGGSEDGGDVVFQTLEFRRNGFRGMYYTECATVPHFHPQHIVRLPNKDGHAYFAVATSGATDPFLPYPYPADPAGILTIYQSDSVDPATDRVSNNPGTDGQIVWEHIFETASSIGDWNHPCKMDVIGSLLLVSVQQWDPSAPCRDGHGSDLDAVLFFDVRDPRNPKYWGKLDSNFLGIPEISSVSLFQAGDRWILTDKNGLKWWWTRNVSPDPAAWTFGGTGSASDAHGQIFNSYEYYGSPASTPANTLLPGTERAMFFDADLDEENLVAGEERFKFYTAAFNSAAASTNYSFGPTTAATMLGTPFPHYSAAPNLWTREEIGTGIEYSYWKKDYDATGISVRAGVPVVYAPLVLYRTWIGDDSDADKIYQIYNPNNSTNGLPPIPAATNLVITINDSGPGSLRSAMMVGGYIYFTNTLNGLTIHLTNGPLVVYPYDVTIDASALPNGIAVSGGGASRVIENAWGNQATLKNLTIRDGDAHEGGGILNVGGSMTLENCTITNNYALYFGGGILNGTLQLTSATSSNAVLRIGPESQGTLVLKNCTVTRNSVGGHGGGIGNIGSALTVEGCTISGNRSERNGAGIYNACGLDVNLAAGFGVVPHSGTVFARNSTISENTTGLSSGNGSALHSDSSAPLGSPVPYGTNLTTLVHCTVARNTNDLLAGYTTAVFNSTGGILTLENNILADNYAGSYVWPSLRGPYTTVGANIITANYGTLMSGPAPLFNNPLLSPLGNNGGPTRTMALALTSPAIGKAVASLNSPSTDQRGQPRPPGSAADLGAFEYPLPDPAGLAGALDSLDLTNVTSVLIPGGFYPAVWFSQSTNTHDGVDAAQSGAIPNDKKSLLTADVTGPGTLTFWWKINANPDDRITFYLGSASWLAGPIFGNTDWKKETVAIPAGTHSLGWEYDADYINTMPGGAGWVDEVVFTPFVPTPIVLNTNDSGPGSLRQIIADFPSGTLITFDPSLSGKTITLTSGQLFIDKNLGIDASALPNGIVISGNNASRVLQVTSGNNVLLNSLTLTRGSATGANPANTGGAIYSFGGNLTLLNSTITSNTATGSGGAITTQDGSLTLSGSTLRGNSAPFGGAIYRIRGTVTLNDCTLADNSATSSGGGGIFNNQTGTCTLNNCTVAGNSASGSGGGVANFNDAQLILSQTTIANNAAVVGGGVWTPATAALSLHNTIIAENSASASGPDIDGAVTSTSGVNLLSNLANSNLSPGPSLLVGNPLLAPLNNYGSATQTRPPLPGSPAIDAGGPTGLVTDQRGAPRPSGPLPDLGAVEAFAFSTLPLIDTDNDGIDDRLEPAYGLVVGNDDRAVDSDGDGSPDWAELFNMTNPTDAADYFHILSLALAAGFDATLNPVFDVTFRSFPGLRYELETGPTPQSFVTLTNSQVIADNHTQTRQVVLNPGQGFLRARRGFATTRWASSVLGFSSQFGTDFWSAARALGQPDTYPNYGDLPTAWASASEDDQREFLELGFGAPAPISSVSIYETYAPGAVDKVSVRNPNTSLWEEVWSSPAAPAPEVARIFTVSFPMTSFPVDAIRLDLNSPAVPDWNEIDAVSIGGVTP